MANIDLNEKTARELLKLASASGLSVEEYVRTFVLAKKDDNDSADQLLGLMAGEVDLVDEVLSDAHLSRESIQFRLGADE